MFSKSTKLNNKNEENGSIPQRSVDNSVHQTSDMDDKIPQIPQSPVPQLPLSQDLALAPQSALQESPTQKLHLQYMERLQHAQARMAMRKTLGNKISQPLFKLNQADQFYMELNNNCFEEAANIYLQEFGLSKNKFADVILNSVKANYSDTVYRSLVASIKLAKLEGLESYTMEYPSLDGSVPPSRDLVNTPSLDLPLDSLLNTDEQINELLSSDTVDLLQNFNMKYTQRMKEKEQRWKEKLDKEISQRLFRPNQADRFYSLVKSNNWEDAAQIFLQEFSVYGNKFADVILDAVKADYGDAIFDKLVTAITKTQLETMHACVMESVLNSYEIWDPLVINREFFDHYNLPVINAFLKDYQPAFEMFSASRVLSSTSLYPVPLNAEELLDIIKIQISDYCYIAVQIIAQDLDKRQPVTMLFQKAISSAKNLSLSWVKQGFIEASKEEYTLDQFVQQISTDVVIGVCNTLQEIQYNFSQKSVQLDDILFIARLLDGHQFFLADYLLLSANALPNTLHLIYSWFVDHPDQEIQKWIRHHEWRAGSPEAGKLKIEPDEPFDKTKLLLNKSDFSTQTNLMKIAYHSKPTLDMPETSQLAKAETSSQSTLHKSTNFKHGLFSVNHAGIEDEIKKMLHNKMIYFSKKEKQAFAKELLELKHGAVSIKHIFQILNDFIKMSDMSFEQIAVRLIIPKDQIGFYNHVVMYLFFTAIENGAYQKAAAVFYEIQMSRFKNRFKENGELIAPIRTMLGQEIVEKFADAFGAYLEMLEQQQSEQRSVRALR